MTDIASLQTCLVDMAKFSKLTLELLLQPPYCLDLTSVASFYFQTQWSGSAARNFALRMKPSLEQMLIQESSTNLINCNGSTNWIDFARSV